MSVTHGGRYKNFEWQLIGSNIFIRNEDGREHTYNLQETYEIIMWLQNNFGEDWFPLANNVELMGRGTEKNGLGIAILNLAPNDIAHAQGSSYLGVVLEEVGIFEWNGAKRGIKWRIIRMPQTIEQLKNIIKDSLGDTHVNEKKKVGTLINLAIEVAVIAHQKQVRKGSDIPYITHPLSVGIILAKAGCSDEVIIAGILHDTVEDTDVTLEYIRDTFGEKVFMIVKGASEPDKSLSWEERKGHTLHFLKAASQEVKFVALADKLNNIRAISSDYVEISDALWKRFKRGKDAQKWYYQGLVEALRDDSANEAYTIIHNQFSQKVREVFGNET